MIVFIIIIKLEMLDLSFMSDQFVGMSTESTIFVSSNDRKASLSLPNITKSNLRQNFVLVPF